MRIFTGFFTSSLNTGKAGELELNTGRLTVRSGSGLAASSFAAGDGGNITINASESVELIGSSPDSSALSSIAAVTEPGSSGKGGNLTLNTGSLLLQDGGRLSVRSRGTGRTGNLDVKADSILLHNEGGFEGTAVSGEGANINVRSLSLQLSNYSFISATAGTEGGAGNGGNINIYTNTLVVTENSDIAANAFLGKGGNILINSFGIFRSANSSITASSQNGISGVVQARTINSNVPTALPPLVSNFAVSEAVLATSCLHNGSGSENSFTLIGTGGLPNNPYDAIVSRYNLIEVQVPATRETGELSQQFLRPLSPIETEEAGGIMVTSDGHTMLVARSQLQALTSASDLVCKTLEKRY